MRRPTLNLLVDTTAFVGFVLLVSTGVLVRYVLPPGSGGRALVWGLDRHAWGAVHLWVAAVFLAVLAIAVAPLVSPVERVEHTGAVSGKPGRAELRGAMTLAELERRTGVPATYVL